jgi:hypothetical protein
MIGCRKHPYMGTNNTRSLLRADNSKNAWREAVAGREDAARMRQLDLVAANRQCLPGGLPSRGPAGREGAIGG